MKALKQFLIFGFLSSPPAFSQALDENPLDNPSDYIPPFAAWERARIFSELVNAIKTDPAYAGIETSLRLGNGPWQYIDRRAEAMASKISVKTPPSSNTVDRLISSLAKDVSASGSFHIRVKVTEYDENGRQKTTEIEMDAGADWSAAAQGSMDESTGKQHK